MGCRTEGVPKRKQKRTGGRTGKMEKQEKVGEKRKERPGKTKTTKREEKEPCKDQGQGQNGSGR